MEKGRHYTFGMDVKLSKNYQTVGVHAEYGRDAEPNETTAQLVERVEKVVKSRILELTNEAVIILEQNTQ